MGVLLDGEPPVAGTAKVIDLVAHFYAENLPRRHVDPDLVRFSNAVLVDVEVAVLLDHLRKVLAFRGSRPDAAVRV